MPGGRAIAMKYAGWNRQARLLRLPTWQIALLLVVGLALGIAIAIVATGVFLIALPIVAVVVLGYRLFGAKRRPRRDAPHVIEGEYEVVENARSQPWRGPNRR